MPNARDASSYGSTQGASPLTISHVTSASANALMVVDVYNDNGDTTTGVTYNGVAMTFIAKVKHAADSTYIYKYYLVAPAAGTHDIVVSYTGTGQWVRAVGATITGAMQTGQPDASGTHTANDIAAGAGYTTNIVTVADNCWVSLAVRNSGGTIGASTNATLVNGADALGTESYDKLGATPAGSIDLIVTNGTAGATQMSSVIASFLPYVVTTVLTETITFSDTLTRVATYLRTLTETITQTDTVTNIRTYILTETITFTDSLEVLTIWAKRTAISASSWTARTAISASSWTARTAMAVSDWVKRDRPPTG